MRLTLLKNIIKTAGFLGIFLSSGASYAVEIYLQAQAYNKTISTGTTTSEVVPMWGYASCEAGWVNCALDGNEQGALIRLAATDSLTIHLQNTLPTPVSIIIPGQDSAGDPVKVADGLGRLRVQSFTHEAGANNGTTDYVWTNLRSGTYLYQSGTHPSIQVPMGLYGALVVEGPATLTSGSCSSGQAAYDSINSCYDIDTVMLFSEVDPVQNAAVAAATTVADYPSTIDYNPSLFLTNGLLTTTMPAVVSGNNVLIRLLNAGLRTHTPSFVGLDMDMIAEDGNLYPGLPRKKNGALLPAGKVMDAIVKVPFDSDGVTAANLTLHLFDRMPSFENEELLDGNISATIVVGDGAPPQQDALEANIAFSIVEDTPQTLDVPGANDIQLINGTSNGTITEVAPTTGTVLQYLYTPDENFSGVDQFSYYRPDNETTYHVTLNVSFVNDIPVGANDSYKNISGSVITVAAPGILANDSDIDGDILTAQIEGTPPAGLALNGDGSFTYSGPNTTFSYRAVDGSSSSDPVTVTLEVNPVSNITLNVMDQDNVAVSDYRWIVEENAMWHPDPAIPNPPESLATSFHKSYMPVVAQGNGAAEFAQLALDPARHYYVSVLPADAASGVGHTIGGAQLPTGATEVTVNVNKQPLPFAQISVFVFEDSSPTNGAVDGAEKGLGLGGFQVTLEEAGGRYGISGGVMAQDANGDPLKNSLDCFGGTPPPVGVILTCPNTPENITAGVAGQVLVKNLYPGKYGIVVTTPVGAKNWIQTSTIEGTKVIDAWVKAGEPPFFQEFGPGSWHVFVGFVNPDRLVMPAGGTNTVSGKVTNFHLSRPPNQQIVDSGSYEALSHTRAWVGLNSAGGTGANFVAVQADENGNFSIANVPDGLYQLVVWDSYLDQIIAYRGLSLPGGGDVGNMPVFQWFARMEHNVFLDANQNGIKEAGEVPMPEQVVNLRWRDGTINQSFPTDTEGFVPFDQTFPFFHWQVVEVDYTRFKATGLTVTVDAGGDVSTGPYPGLLQPQQQGPCNQADIDNDWNGCDGKAVGDPYATPNVRTETGIVLTQGFQGFMGQTSIFDWGKAPYVQGENGGISGIVYYSSTRAENDPRLAVGEPWEPGIPSVKVRLYREVTASDGSTKLALFRETETDNWDKSLPTGCPGADPDDVIITGGNQEKCYDGLRNFNQARPAIFDGGYAFTDIPSGKYVVEVVPPVGYELLKEEDVNVSFGDVFANLPVAVMLPGGGTVNAVIPDPATVQSLSLEPGIAQPKCVGIDRKVPDFLSLFPGEMADAPFAGAIRPGCDRKEVMLSDHSQAAADFFLFTSTPIASHFTGMILDDLAQEFNRFSPQFGEKWAPPFVPVSLRDHNGKEISRVYSDQWGRMNGLVPSTFTANAPSPSGYSPAMVISCMNDPGPILDTRAGSPTQGQMITDPQYNPAYSNFCYTMQYMPGTTTYLDTPVLPVSAFASGYNPVSCSLEEGTPMIRQVDGTDTGPLVAPGGTIRISSLGNGVSVANPAYEGPLGAGVAAQKTILKDYSFGTTQGMVTLAGESLVITSWNENTIEVTAPSTVMSGELVVTRSNGNTTENAITVTVSNVTPIRVVAGSSIQDAIDGANPGDLIIVEPGTYNELVILWKPVRLQGSGAGVTHINAVKQPTEKLVGWRTKMDCLFGIGTNCSRRVDALPNQPVGAVGFGAEEGAAITVLGVFDPGERPRPRNSFFRKRARIDGFSITGGDIGGGIFVNGNAHRLEISNNYIFGNNGLYAGGIRIGRPFLELKDEGPYNFNRNIKIHNNMITQNGGLGGVGGGLSILTGTDRYRVSNNFICGNFTTGDGGGIGHLGFSDKGKITNNKILYNQSFSQANSRSGGGIFIGGEPPVGNNLTLGSGSVTVDSNLIQGNNAGAGHGGGIRAQFVNGEDITNTINPRNGQVRPWKWNKIRLINNIIVNNVAGWSGGGVSLQDTARSFIVNNTIAHNDSTATVSATFTTGNPNISANQPAGISSEPHSTGLNAVIPPQRRFNRYRNFSNPKLSNNIIWQNRSFHYDATMAGGAGLVPMLSQSTVGECISTTNYADLGVLGGQFSLNPRYSVLTDVTGYHRTNTSADPALVNGYCNGGRKLENGAPGAMSALPAVDEGGATWIDVRYGPLTQSWSIGSTPWDYHITATSSAVDAGSRSGAPRYDFDNGDRPSGAAYDIGADEFVTTAGTGGIVTYSSGDFGNVLFNETATLTIIASVSEAPVTFVSSSNPASPFAKTADTCSGTTVSVGGNCSFTVTYTPTNDLQSFANIAVENDNVEGSPQMINLSGIGIRPPGTVSFTSASAGSLNADGTVLDFGNIENGNFESTVTITVTNYPVTFASSRVRGGRFKKSGEDDGDTCSGKTLTMGSTCSVTIIFNANGNRLRRGRLIVRDNGLNNPQILLLRGR